MRGFLKIAIPMFLIGLLCLIGYFYFSFGYGSFGGFISELKQPPDEKTLTTRRADALARLTSIQDDLGGIPGLTLYEKTRSDMCAKGEHDWKRSDSFAYLCAYRLTYYYGTQHDYKALLMDLEKKLDDDGWEIMGRTSTTLSLVESWEKSTEESHLAELPDFVKRSAPFARADDMTLAINSFHGYGVPWAKSPDEPSPFGFGLGIGQTYYEDTSAGNPGEIAGRVLASGQQPFMLAVSIVYFDN